MKRLRVPLLLAVTGGLLAGALYWSRPQPGFATPADCLEAYREARQSGDVPNYLRCLAEPLRSEVLKTTDSERALADSLRRGMKDVKTWVLLPQEETEGTRAILEVDEGRMSGIRRHRFHLARFREGWLIVGIDPPREIPAAIPYGTHISKGL
jgi:hypothetical protein